MLKHETGVRASSTMLRNLTFILEVIKKYCTTGKWWQSYAPQTIGYRMAWKNSTIIFQLNIQMRNDEGMEERISDKA